MAVIPATLNLKDARKDADQDSRNYIDITEVVLAIWPQFILLSVAFLLGVKNNNGLWSTDQPFMTVNSDQPQTAWGYGYGPPQGAAPPMQESWQQQPVYYQPPQEQQTQYSPVQKPAPYHNPSQQYAPAPVMQSWSPPPHEDAMGLNHQADGTPPQVASQQYHVKN